MIVRYRAVTPTAVELRVDARDERSEGRKQWIKASLATVDGTVLAQPSKMLRHHSKTGPHAVAGENAAGRGRGPGSALPSSTGEHPITRIGRTISSVRRRQTLERRPTERVTYLVPCQDGYYVSAQTTGSDSTRA